MSNNNIVQHQRERERTFCKLLNGNCLELLKKIPDSSIDMIATDPPYLISTTNGDGTVDNTREELFKVANMLFTANPTLYTGGRTND